MSNNFGAEGSDEVARVLIDPDSEEDVTAFLYGASDAGFRAVTIALYCTRAISRVGVSYVPKGSAQTSFTLYMTTTSYLGDVSVGGTGSTTVIAPNSDGSNSFYLDVVPADRVLLNIGINVSHVSASFTVDDHWKFTVIGSNNKKLGVHPV